MDRRRHIDAQAPDEDGHTPPIKLPLDAHPDRTLDELVYALETIASIHTTIYKAWESVAPERRYHTDPAIDVPALARMVAEGRPISLRMPYVNVISQRDANERALRCLELCANPAEILNVCGPITRVRDLAERLGEFLGRAPVFAGDEPELARVTSDALCVARFGAYRDSVEEMVEAAARWIGAGGENWEKPTMFGVADGQY